MHWWWWLPCKVLTSTSGAVWGSVSWPRTLRHLDQGNWTSYLLITRWSPWVKVSWDPDSGKLACRVEGVLKLTYCSRYQVFRKISSLLCTVCTVLWQLQCYLALIPFRFKRSLFDTVSESSRLQQQLKIQNEWSPSGVLAVASEGVPPSFISSKHVFWWTEFLHTDGSADQICRTVGCIK